jgi:hypothetical protein
MFAVWPLKDKVRVTDVERELGPGDYAYRGDGRLERFCEHGIGHTVGHRDPKQLDDPWMSVHGCDGCCRTYPRQRRADGER